MERYRRSSRRELGSALRERLRGAPSSRRKIVAWHDATVATTVMEGQADGARPDLRLDHDPKVEARHTRGVQPGLAADGLPRREAARVRVLLRRRQRGGRHLHLGLTGVARAVPPLRGRGGATTSDGAFRGRRARWLLHRTRAEDPRTLTRSIAQLCDRLAAR